MKKHEQHKRAFIIWLAIYPLITILMISLGEHLAPFPLYIRTLVTTLIAVPVMFYGLIPLLNKVFYAWLNN
ncbi:hypothetical protein WBG78_09645 [Chryseolinea sp. T2]|uniref:hypothetical protein n=1 Tax=Chryseolinea sp. T2 TaxID=3129255 RepID=UPI003077A59D